MIAEMVTNVSSLVGTRMVSTANAESLDVRVLHRIKRPSTQPTEKGAAWQCYWNCLLIERSLLRVIEL